MKTSNPKTVNNIQKLLHRYTSSQTAASKQSLLEALHGSAQENKLRALLQHGDDASLGSQLLLTFDEDIMEIALQNGADPDECVPGTNESLLLYAARRGEVGAMLKLAKGGADLQARSENGENLWHCLFSPTLCLIEENNENLGKKLRELLSLCQSSGAPLPSERDPHNETLYSRVEKTLVDDSSAAGQWLNAVSALVLHLRCKTTPSSQGKRYADVPLQFLNKYLETAEAYVRETLFGDVTLHEAETRNLIHESLRRNIRGGILDARTLAGDIDLMPLALLKEGRLSGLRQLRNSFDQPSTLEERLAPIANILTGLACMHAAGIPLVPRPGEPDSDTPVSPFLSALLAGCLISHLDENNTYSSATLLDTYGRASQRLCEFAAAGMLEQLFAPERWEGREGELLRIAESLPASWLERGGLDTVAFYRRNEHLPVQDCLVNYMSHRRQNRQR